MMTLLIGDAHDARLDVKVRWRHDVAEDCTPSSFSIGFFFTFSGMKRTEADLSMVKKKIPFVDLDYRSVSKA